MAKRRTARLPDEDGEAVENKGGRTRARIKAAFAQLLTQKSFAAITISDICRTSDITVGGLYFHFASQDELLDEVMREYSEDLGSALDRSIQAGRGARLAAAVCAAFVAAYEERTGLARAFQQLRRTRDSYAARWRAISGPRIDRLAVLLALERPDLSAAKAKFLAHALITMIVSQLDLAYVYAGRHRSEAGGDAAKGLTVLWRRMIDAKRP